ncbi:CtaG protein [Geobacillus proteiniphilus]|uniref:CtaG protein n=1 Tax=Geobacillus proteiniphilus TaxID=860353 RepID=A0A1Q5T176_9BACL|nr:MULTISPECIES: cytochrome c oxidase assembly factor CtaG [Geobacillus]OKO94038.1 CtaG protein [Geobacillus proteiniphilus]OPX04633.1 cytochrome c oxidase assembly factor CtaG [Geobacillus sp. LEMMY01]
MFQSLQMFGPVALWSPFFLLVLAAVALLYIGITGPWRQRFGLGDAVSGKQKAYFLTGIVLLYICKGSPVDLMGHLTFTAHMVQMAVLYLIVPQCFILGIPAPLYERAFRIAAVRRVFRLLTKPIVALLLFNGLFSLYHVPFIFDAVKMNMWLHAFVTSVIFVAAFCMWWPLVNKLPDWQTLSGLKKMGYIFADGMLLTPACALIIFTDTPLYATYTDPKAWMTALALCVPQGTLASLDLTGPQMFLSMSPLHDQQLGGVLMKIIQEIVYGTMLFFIFTEWYRKEREKEPSMDMEPRPTKL